MGRVSRLDALGSPAGAATRCSRGLGWPIFLTGAAACTPSAPLTLSISPTGTISGNVTFQAEVTGDPVWVQWTLDGAPLGVTDAPFTVDLDTTTLPDGPWELRALAADMDERTASAIATVNIDNHGFAEDDLTLLGPSRITGLCGVVPLEASTPFRSPELRHVQLWIGDLEVGATKIPPFRWDWPSQGWEDNTWRFRAVAVLKDGRSTSRVATISADNTGECDQLPTIELTEPGYEAFVYGAVRLDALASDDENVVSQIWSVDGEILAETSTWPYDAVWNTTGLDPGLHRVTVTAVDTVEQTTTTESWVTVDPAPPTARLLAPVEGARVRGNVPTQVEVGDETALAAATLYVDDYPVADLVEGEQALHWDSTFVGHGDHVVTVSATDRAGQTTTDSRTVNVDNLPWGEFLRPLDGAEVSGLTPVAALVLDDAADIRHATLTVDGVESGPLDLTQETRAWDACLAASGTRVLSANVVDSGGQTGTITPISVSVIRPFAVEIVNESFALSPVTPASVWVSSEFEVTRVAWDIDGVPLGDGTAVPTPAMPTPCFHMCGDDCSGWFAELDTTSLPEGDLLLTATVTNTNGDTVTDSVWVSLRFDSDWDGISDVAYGGRDCDDTDPAVLPSASEVCDGIDNDCDGNIDGETDVDADGFPISILCSEADLDCDDTDPSIHPGAAEVCDGVDNDCDGRVDGWPLIMTLTELGNTSSDIVAGWNATGNVFTLDDEAVLRRFEVWFDPQGTADVSFDVYAGMGSSFTRVATDPQTVTGAAGWYVSTDFDLTLYPGSTYVLVLSRSTSIRDYYDRTASTVSGLNFAGAVEATTLDGGETLNDAPSTTTAYAQRVILGHQRVADRDVDEDGVTGFCGDCDDFDAARSPDWTEVCNAIDDDCDGVSDDGFDPDGDGYGDCLDCDEANVAVNPGITEVCDDSVDDDCDGYARRCRGFGSFALPDVTAYGLGASGDGAGEAVALGDLDGDGLAEVLVGAPGSDAGGSSSGAVWIWAGPAASTGDLGVPTSTISGAAGGEVGDALGIGDIEGDGAADLVVGAMADTSGGAASGAVWVASAPAWSLTDFSAGSRLTGPEGARVGSAVLVADLDGDALDDVAAGAPEWDEGQGGVWLVPGPVSASSSLADHMVLVGEAGSALGTSLDEGDMSGDGVADLLIGAPGGSGAVWLFEGPWDTDLTVDDSDCGWTGEAALGRSISVVGDVNADGYLDALLGAPEVEDAAGGAWLVTGACSGTRSLGSTLASISGAQADELGAAVLGAGDIDADGHADLVVGAPGWGGVGAAALFYGPLEGDHLLEDADLLLLGEVSGDRAGAVMAGGADVNGDGYPDVLLGTPDAEGGGRGAGAAWLLVELP